jgi:hypothetical protein
MDECPFFSRQKSKVVACVEPRTCGSPSRHTLAPLVRCLCQRCRPQITPVVHHAGQASDGGHRCCLLSCYLLRQWLYELDDLLGVALHVPCQRSIDRGPATRSCSASMATGAITPQKSSPELGSSRSSTFVCHQMPPIWYSLWTWLYFARLKKAVKKGDPQVHDLQRRGQPLEGTGIQLACDSGTDGMRMDNCISGFRATRLFPPSLPRIFERLVLFDQGGVKKHSQWEESWLQRQQVRDTVVLLPAAVKPPRKRKRKRVNVAGRLLTKEMIIQELEAPRPVRQSQRKKTSVKVVVDLAN